MQGTDMGLVDAAGKKVMQVSPPQALNRGDYFESKHTKQLEQMREAAADTRVESTIFKGVIVWFNGSTTPTNEVLRSLLHAAGGETRNDHTSDVTHVVANAFADWRVAAFSRMRRPPAVVQPLWITESVARARRLREADYTLSALAPPRPLFGSSPAPAIPPRGSPRHAGNDPTFVSTYFEQSRLHHIGSWRSDWIDVLMEHRRQSSDVARGSSGAGAGDANNNNANAYAAEAGEEEIQWPRVIAHVDIDCFFAQIALLDHPHLRLSPIAVAHSALSRSDVTANPFSEHEVDADVVDDNDNGGGGGGGVSALPLIPRARGNAEISSANYVARKFGVRAGMFVEKASQLCPSLIILPYDFQRSRETTRFLYKLLLRLSPRVQALSCDEAYIDLSGFRAPLAALRSLRASFEESTGCTVSVGVGSSLLAARLATQRAKPNGLFLLPADTQSLAAVLAPMPVNSLPGIGPRAESSLLAIGVRTVGEGAVAPRASLEAALGHTAALSFIDATRGVDTRDIVTIPPLRKSVGVDMNYGIRLSTRADAERVLRGLADELAKRMVTAGDEEVAFSASGQIASGGQFLKAKSLTLKVLVRRKGAGEPRKFNGHGSVYAVSRCVRPGRTLISATDFASCAYTALAALGLDPQELRGLGLSAGDLERPALGKGEGIARLGFTRISADEVIEVLEEDQGERRTIRPSRRSAPPLPQSLAPPPPKRTRPPPPSIFSTTVAKNDNNNNGSDDDVVFIEVAIPPSSKQRQLNHTTGTGSARISALREETLKAWIARAPKEDPNGETLAADATAALLVDGSADDAVIFLRALQRLTAAGETPLLKPACERITKAVLATALIKFGYSLIWE